MSKNKQPARFDFKKKPRKPGFLMGVAKHIISLPDLRNRPYKLERRGMEELDGKPYLCLINHASMVDLNVMLHATNGAPVNNVMTLEGFRDFTEPLMRHLGVLGKRKYVQDFQLIKNMKYCVDKLQTVFVLFPEARYTLDGCTSYLTPSLGSLVKFLRVPVVVIRIHGNHVSCPHWNWINKKGPIEAEMYPIVSAEETKTLSADEIYARIVDNFQYDDYAWQRDNHIVLDHPKRANGLHTLLYKCACCSTEGKMHSEGIHLWCEACGKKWEMTELGELKALEGETRFSHIPDWSKWERACVRKEIREGTYRFEDEVIVETLPNSLKFYHQGKGKLTQTPEGTTLDCESVYGEPLHVEWKPLNLDSMHVEFNYKKSRTAKGDCVDLSVPDDSYWCYTTKRDVIVKLAFATEEIHFFAKEQAEAQKKQAAQNS